MLFYLYLTQLHYRYNYAFKATRSLGNEKRLCRPMIITCTVDVLSMPPTVLDVRNDSTLLLRLRGGGRGVSSLSVKLHTTRDCFDVIAQERHKLDLSVRSRYGHPKH